MEYRRRRRTNRRRQGTGGGGRALILIVLLLGAVYLVSVSAAGSWLSKNVVEPIAALFTQKKETQIVERSDESVKTSVDASGRIEIPAMECYLLQTGVFSDEANAEAAADTLKEQGGAGYVYHDGERYRVFAAGYNNEDDARDMKQLLSDNGTDCSVYEMRSAGKFDVTVTAGTDSTVSQLQTVLFSLLSAHDDLLELEKSFDDSGMTVKAAAAAAQEIYSQLERGTKQTDGLPASVVGLLNDVKAKIKELGESGDDDVDTFSSKLRYVQIMIACRFTETISDLIG